MNEVVARRFTRKLIEASVTRLHVLCSAICPYVFLAAPELWNCPCCPDATTLLSL
jgi:hypothetical protein